MKFLNVKILRSQYWDLIEILDRHDPNWRFCTIASETMVSDDRQQNVREYNDVFCRQSIRVGSGHLPSWLEVATNKEAAMVIRLSFEEVTVTNVPNDLVA